MATRRIVVDYQVARHWQTEDRRGPGTAALNVLALALSAVALLAAGRASSEVSPRTEPASVHAPGMAASSRGGPGAAARAGLRIATGTARPARTGARR
jgi:hypothetical protein